MANGPVSCARIMGRFAPLQRLQNEIAEQQRLLLRVRSLLPANLRAHCVAAVRNADRITLYSDSPVWASRLRFLAKGILDTLRGQDHPARELRTRVLIASDRAAGARKRRRMAPLSQETSRMLSGVAATLDDPALRAALGRLARHRRSGPGLR
jgi:hypothetical protein